MRSIGFPDLLVGLVLLVGLCLYWVPTIAGWNKRDRWGIFFLNLGAGWTGIGWVVAIVWAFRGEKREQWAAHRAEAITRLNLLSPHPPVGEQPAYVPLSAYPPPPKTAVLPTWLLALLFAFIIAGVMYLGAGYFHNAEPTTPATHPQPRKVHRVTKPLG
jgi:hypothetical protein